MDINRILLSKEFALLVLSVLLLGWISYDGLQLMVSWWERDEYSHGPMIPFVAAYLLFQKRQALAVAAERDTFLGILVLAAGLFVWLLGELSAIYTLIQYAFVIGLFGIALQWVGISGVKVIWASIAYLIFMIPLPNFLYFNLSQELQLISSSLGVAVIRLFDISVYLEGNVIDLGVYQLQVVEACSGLRYLFPLMSFGFLIAYIFRGPVWQKVIIFLSTVPITVLMNSFRIGVIGVTVEHFGIAAAEGFLHDFEGWIVFMACLGVLLVEIWLFYIFSDKRRPFAEILDLDFGAAVESSDERNEGGSDKPSLLSPSVLAGFLMLLIAVPTSQYMSVREDLVPDRQAFNDFPLAMHGWIGREESVSQAELDALRLTDYFMGNYKKVGDKSVPPINLYSAWYEEQRKGASIHSPRTCLPGGGWQIGSHTIAAIDEVDAYGKPLNVNRVVMRMGENRQLVYYWFQGRSRNITNEYMAKWYIFWDSLTRSRTDGALVRLVTYIPEGQDVTSADERLKGFLAQVYPKLPAYVPD